MKEKMELASRQRHLNQNQTKTYQESGTFGRPGGRIGYLDALKCLGIFFVLVHHVRNVELGVKVYDTLPGIMLYSFNMPLFFFVSGLLAYKPNMSVVDTFYKIKQKFVFLVVPAAIFKLFYNMALHHNPIEVLYKGFGNYWFTVTLFECFFLYYLFHLIFRKEGLRHVLLLILAFAGVGLLSLYPHLRLGILDMNHLTKYFQFFVFGILSMRYKEIYEKVMRNEIVKAFVLLSFFALLFLLDYSIWPKPVFHFMRDIILRYFGTFMVVSFFVCHASWFDESKTIINKVILKVGKISLAIYLVHYFFLPHSDVLKKCGDSLDCLTIYLISLLYSIAIIIICVVFILLLSNSKFIKKYALGRK